MSPTCYAADSHRGEYGLGTVLSVCVLVFVLVLQVLHTHEGHEGLGGGYKKLRPIRVIRSRATVSVRDVLCSCDRGF